MVEQLRREAAIKRINVSQAIEDIKVVPLFGHSKNYIRDRTIGKTPFFYPSDFIAFARRCTLRLRQANKAVHQIGKLESAFFMSHICDFIQTLDIHYALLMTSQKESPRNHPWVLPRKVAYLV